MSHDSRGALLKKGDRVLVEGVLTQDPSADGGYCNANVTFITPEQRDPPPMSPPQNVFNTRMLTKVGAALLLFLLLLANIFPGSELLGEELPKHQVDTSEVARRGDRVTVTGDGIRDGGEQLFSMAMAPPADDSGRWTVTVWGSSKDANSLALVKAFERDAALAAFVAEPPAELKRQPWAHFNFYQADDRTQQWRFPDAQIPLTGPFPIVTIQVPRNGSFSGIASVPGKNGKPEARALIIDRIEAGEMKDPATVGRRIRSSVGLYCEKLAKSGFRAPAELVANVLEPRGLHQQLSGSHGQSFPWGPQTPPAVPAFNPQWPLGGPAADSGASIEQLQAALPGAPAEFVLAQVKQKATVEAAQAAWKFLQSQLKPVEPPKTDPTPPAVAPAPANGLGTVVTSILALLGVTNVLSIAMAVWALYRAGLKAQGKAPAIPEEIYELIKNAVGNKPQPAKA